MIHEKKETAEKLEAKSEVKPEPAQVKTEVEKPQPKVETPVASWRSWGAFNVISNASKTVASITTQVSQSIIDSINIPDPEEMAKIQAEEKKKMQTSDEGSTSEDKNSEKSDDSRFKLDNLLSGVSQISSKVVSGGLDTLEGIGKKTINILNDTDPNIKNKIRNMNVNNQPNLSDLLKEAKDRDDNSSTSGDTPQTYTFDHLLDEHKGLVFLEALEILSNQSKMKIDLLLKPLSGKVLTEMQETMDEVKELCELDTENIDESITAENIESKLKAATEDLNVKLNFTDIVTHTKESHQWLDELDSSVQPSSIYQESVHVMAKACALSLNNLQKLAELLLSQDHRSTADESDSLTQ